MKISFSGLETQLSLQPNYISVFEVENKTLFTKICQSFLSNQQENAVEPYYYWGDSDKKLPSLLKPIIITNPFDLPWSHKLFQGALYNRINQSLLEDDPTRQVVEKLNARLRDCVNTLSIQMESNYTFGVEWEMSRFLKAFGFSVELIEGESLIENIEKFLALASDVSLKHALIFINFKSFLSEKDIDSFYERVIFSNLAVLMLESSKDSRCFAYERKKGVDQYLLEY